VTWLRLVCLTAVLVWVPDAQAQKLRDKDKPRNDPVQCPYCFGDPDLMKASGIVSHGPFKVAMTDTAGLDDFLPTSDIRWTETEHFELGFALGPMKVTQKDKLKIRAELTRLAELLPDTINIKEKLLDPWLRSHLYALRMEDLYQQMLGILQVEQSDFPDGLEPWKMDTKYMGEGPYMGQKGKFEVLLLASEGALSDVLRDQFGLVIKRTQRYNVIPTDSLIVVIHAQQAGLRNDPAMHGHVAFNLAHMFMDGYKHYTYDIPVWLREGVAHWIERSISPDFNSFDSSEGSAGAKTRKSDWKAPTRKLVNSGDAPRMAQLMRMKGFAEFELDHHFTTWSMIDFLITEHPDVLAQLFDRIKGMTNEEGIGDGTQLPDVHREAFQELLGMSYREFDAAWGEWVLATY